jgi:hypothetical protein
MAAALDWPGRLAYVVDDDVAAGTASATLTSSYRERLARFDTEFHAPLLARADIVLVTSDLLARRLAARGVSPARLRRIDPAWCHPFADQSHFAGLQQGAPLRIAHLGSGSHLAAFSHLAPALVEVLDRDPRTHITYVAQRAVEPALEAHPRARRIEPKTWPEYRRWLGQHRFHLALYPLLEDGFDRARSINKMLEHAVVGGVGLYPEDWDEAAMIEPVAPALAASHPGAGALSAPGEPTAWAEALLAATALRESLGTLAGQAAARLSHRRFGAMQRDLWCDFFGLEVS